MKSLPELAVEDLNSDVPRLLGKQIRRLRRISGATQEDLSDRCCIYRTYLSRVEAGTANPSLTVLVSLAKALGVRVSDLLHATQANEGR
jgi:transcriptional regulator with XRE-family HTH domain